MAVPRKQRRVAPQQSSSDSDDNNENEDNQEMEIIEVDFDVKIPESTDRPGIKNLLQQLFLKARINISELADILIEQSNITGVVKEAADSEDMDIDDDLDVNFGVFSVVNITEKRNVECIKQIHSYLLNHCKEVCSKSQYEMFQNILEDSSKHVGFIISERLINIPAKISVPLYTGLTNDMCSAREKKQAYEFAYYLIVCKTATFITGPGQENTIYLNPEEELIAEEADFQFEFQVQDEKESGVSGNWSDDDDDEGISKRKVLLIHARKWDIICNKLAEEFGRDLQQNFN